jgi:hypothetical protein
MIYVLYRGETLQSPCGKNGSVIGEWLAKPGFIPPSKHWECGIPQEFPRGVRRVGSRYFGFPCFPLLGISTLACRLGLARIASDDIGVYED